MRFPYSASDGTRGPQTMAAEYSNIKKPSVLKIHMLGFFVMENYTKFEQTSTITCTSNEDNRC